MIRFIFYAVLNILWSVVCHILNPFVVLFGDKEGNLPNWLLWFSTHDNPLDGDKDHLERNKGDKWYQVYLRRIKWLYRNTGYYFRYYVLGYDLPSRDKLIIKGNENIRSTYPAIEGWCFSYDASKNILSRGWMLYVVKSYGIPFVPRLGIRIYLGWKFMGFAEGQKMLAWHISPFRMIG